MWAAVQPFFERMNLLRWTRRREQFFTTDRLRVLLLFWVKYLQVARPHRYF